MDTIKDEELEAASILWTIAENYTRSTRESRCHQVPTIEENEVPRRTTTDDGWSTTIHQGASSIDSSQMEINMAQEIHYKPAEPSI